ncbi:DUF895 domain membrane protein [Nowakowskiella sp. JEL0407]|nr:DUF895 domain membrane protein [Nowakowskiella sp. JEL0407]
MEKSISNDEKGETPTSDSPVNPKSFYTNIFKAIYLGISFALLFISYGYTNLHESNVTQSNLTTLFPEIGLYTFCIIYTCFVLGGLLGPEFENLLGSKWAMVLGSFTIPIFVASINFGIEWIVYCTACLVGFGNGILWTNQGIYLAEIRNQDVKNAGLIVGLFFTVCSVNGFIGNIISMSILSSGGSTDVMIWAMAAIGVLGTICLSLITPKDKSSKPDVQTELAESKILKSAASTENLLTSTTALAPKSGILDRFTTLKNTALQNRTMLLMLYMYTQGSNLSFTFTVAPSFIPGIWDESRRSLMLSQMFMCYGLSAMILSILTGKIYDRFCWRPLVVLNVLSLVGGIALLFTTQLLGTEDENTFKALMIISGLFFGSSDTFPNSLINIILSGFGVKS